MYVAVTRAKRRLYVTHAQQRMLHGQIRYGIRSRFLDEIPAALCQAVEGYARRPAARQDAWAPGGISRRQDAWRGASSYPRDPGGSAPAGEPMPAWVDDGRKYRIGQSVSHARFGQGVVLGYEGQGSDARVQIKFSEAGTKWLALDVAKLSAA